MPGYSYESGKLALRSHGHGSSPPTVRIVAPLTEIPHGATETGMANIIHPNVKLFYSQNVLLPTTSLLSPSPGRKASESLPFTNGSQNPDGRETTWSTKIVIPKGVGRGSLCRRRGDRDPQRGGPDGIQPP